MTGGRVQGRVFGEVAGEYERIRPGYPPALVEDVLEYAALDGRPALEAGAGTGKATLAFAERGARITAVEPDPAMLAVLRARLAGSPAEHSVRPVLGTFEEFAESFDCTDGPAAAEKFGLLYSAQAWHWVDPVRRWDLAARVLGSGGALALFWNGDQLADPGAMETLLATQRRYAPQLVAQTSHATPEPPGPREQLVAHLAFGELVDREYEWERQLSTLDFVGLLSTLSPYRILDEPVRAQLFGALLAGLPDPVTLSMSTVLHLARRA